MEFRGQAGKSPRLSPAGQFLTRLHLRQRPSSPARPTQRTLTFPPYALVGIQAPLQPQVAPLFGLLTLLLLEFPLPVLSFSIQPVPPGLNLRVRPWRRHPLLHRQDFWLLREADDVGGT